MTSRPESGQKNLSPAIPIDKQRETSRNAMTPVKAVKQIIQNKDGGELNKIPSSSCVKSGKGMGLAIGKIAAAMKFAGRIKRIKDESHPEQEVDGKKSLTVHQTIPKIAIWDDELASLELKRERASVIRKEINFIDSNVIPPTPEIIDVFVKKTRVPEHAKQMQIFHVLKPCVEQAEWKEFKGPRYNKQGEIIRHSILGDWEMFLQHASVNQKGLQVLKRECEEKVSISVKPLEHSIGNNRVTKPVLKEELALQNWTNQMKTRRRNQRFLARKLNCHIDQLLMHKSDQYLQKKAFVDQLECILHHNEPDVCFWKQEEQIGSKQIAATLTRSERGFPPLSPVMSGDADSFMSEKGKSFKLEPVKLADSEYCRQVLAVVGQQGGRIMIANQELFKQLEILGHSIILNTNQTNEADGKGEHSGFSKGGNLREVEYLLPDKCDANETPHDLYMKLKNSWMEGQPKESMKGPALCIGGTILTYRGNHSNKSDTSPKDKIIFERSVFFSDNVTHFKSFEHSNKQRYKIARPIIIQKDVTGFHSNQNASATGLFSNKSASGSGLTGYQNASKSGFQNNQNAIDSEFPSNRSSRLSGNTMGVELVMNECVDGKQNQCSQGQDDAVAKETIIMMTGKVGKVLRAHAVIENVGSTAVKFNWLKAHQPVNFGVTRKQRRPFYFNDNDGVILPRDKIYVPMLFKTVEPGIFTETWLLKTIPELELGAKIKFMFKVVVSDDKPYQQDILDVELNHHGTSVSTLQMMYKTAMESLKPRETTYASSHKREATHNVPLVLSVAKLRKLLLKMPTNASSKEPVVPEVMNKGANSVGTSIPGSNLLKELVLTQEDINFQRKEDLLLVLYQEIGILSFRPLKPLASDTQMRILLVSLLLQSAVDTMVTQATILAGTLELNPKERVKNKVETDKKKQSKDKAKTNKDRKGGKETSPPATSAAPREETYFFSAAYKMRTSSDETKDEALLAKYDEKVYCATYWILQQTIGDVFDLLEAL
ncbi:uncharacterized protein LOC127867162 isoform X2 [Dreissena polymorpha]|uniref:uncharacterized protein LOC127867162 isoform X2 n=1 Tax=Dreissena polymorpha TaxID=45954 RepID=UPI002265366C|nr:uncharacterized protein LOC127867162 isoform X2 [Dreissena polymorpha]